MPLKSGRQHRPFDARSPHRHRHTIAPGAVAFEAAVARARVGDDDELAADEPAAHSHATDNAAHAVAAHLGA